MTLLWLFSFVLVAGVLAYHYSSLVVWTIGLGVFLGVWSKFGDASWFILGLTWFAFLGLALPLNLKSFRRQYLSARLFETYKKRLMLFHELFPKIDNATLKLSKKRTGKDRQRLVIAMRKIKNKLRLQN